MPSWVEDASFWGLFAFFFTIVFVRTQATYWLARVVTSWTLDRTRPVRPWMARVHRWLSGESAHRGVAAVRRWGLVAVPLSFLGTGTKTVINAGAGIVRLPFGRYLAAMVLGCLAHAVIYATVGWAAWSAALAVAAGSPWGVAALAGIVLLIVIHVVRRRRRRLARSADEPASGEAAADAAEVTADRADPDARER